MNLVVHLKGGLGNQLFQYATGRAIAARGGAELVLDNVTGFARDRRFRRSFELASFPIRARTAGALERSIPVLHRILCPFGRRRNAVRRMPYGVFLRETSHRFLEEIDAFKPDRDTWSNGYWQSPRYFESMAVQIRSELEPPAPEDPRMLALGIKAAERESLAVGVRLYEEDRNPAANARDGRLKSVAEQAEAVHSILKEFPDATPYVFCTHRAEALDALRMPPHAVFVTESDGFRGAVPNLWLLSRCRHHVFNNSSFYWWGAWLSERAHESRPGRIIAGDNFINHDCVPSRWSQF